jgi:opacity protein-like surface antigen
MKTLSAMALLVSILSSAMASAATFDGNQCLGDCSGHQAGYDWAEQNDVDDESSCSTPSQSFNEGCQSYIDENSGTISGTTLSDDDDDEEDDDE